MSNLKSQFEDMEKGALTIPNLLSLIRIILIPVFVCFFFSKMYKWALLVIVLSGLSDAFDGKIARKFNQISKLGKLLDPAADKLTQMALAVVFFFDFHSSSDVLLRSFSYVFWLFCLKELVMIIGSFVLLGMDIVPQAALIYGKVATFTYYLVMLLLLCFAPGFGAFNAIYTLSDVLLISLVSLSVVLTLAAFFAYLPDTLRKVKGRDKNSKSNENLGD